MHRSGLLKFYHKKDHLGGDIILCLYSVNYMHQGGREQEITWEEWKTREESDTKGVKYNKNYYQK